MAASSISCVIPKDANFPNLKEVPLPQMRREIADLFAWTVVSVAVSALFERVFLFVLGKIFDALEHAV